MSNPAGRQKRGKQERCSICGSRKFAVENGLRFCKNCGTQAEGFVQYDLGDDVEAGQTGAVARRQREVRQTQKRHLTGQAGKALFLEAMQLILRHQVVWLVKEKRHLEELETVVRDLWTVRIRGFPEESKEDQEQKEIEMFSSQPASSPDMEETQTKASQTRSQRWDSNMGSHWPLPKISDTLALCYLGCLLLRIPTSIADFFHWANAGNIPYRRAVRKIRRFAHFESYADILEVSSATSRDPGSYAWGVYQSSENTKSGPFGRHAITQRRP
jgi:RNA polymerase I-specific transcription initiation factor RRN7